MVNPLNSKNKGKKKVQNPSQGPKGNGPNLANNVGETLILQTRTKILAPTLNQIKEKIMVHGPISLAHYEVSLVITVIISPNF
jgi:hypothetical protein